MDIDSDQSCVPSKAGEVCGCVGFTPKATGPGSSVGKEEERGVCFSLPEGLHLLGQL